MIMMTLNIMGLANIPKKLVVRRLIDEHFLDVIFLQESMCDGSILVGELETMLKYFKFLSMDAKGKSRGLVLGWRTHKFHFLNAWAMCSGLCVSLYSIELKMDLVFVNLYGPYMDKELFWNNLFKLDGLMSYKLIFGGDLNFSLGYSEILGVKSRVDVLSNFFTRQLDRLGLVDISPSFILPTWSNRRVGSENICKILDQLLISADLLVFTC